MSRNQQKSAGKPVQEEREELLREKVVSVNRVTKVVKGGRILAFSALVVVGDDEGRVGVGKGKAREVAVAVQKAIVQARRNLTVFPLCNGTLQHRVTGHYGASSVTLMPAKSGTGVIAGGAARMFLGVTQIRDVVAKIRGSSNPHNVLRAMRDASASLCSPEAIAAKRGKPIQKILDSVSQSRRKG